MAGREFVSVEASLSAAEAAMARGAYAEALGHLRRLAGETHIVDYEYNDWLVRLADCYARLGRGREAGLVYLYLHYFDMAHKILPAEAGDVRGRVFALQKRWPDAARAFETAGLPVQAAIMYEEAKDHPRAASAWSALLDERRLSGSAYERALVHANLGLAFGRVGDTRIPDGHHHLALAQRLLEQVADDFETLGQRERAFDCYQILLKLGKDSGAFENLCEGYLNGIRILKEDGLKFYVLQYYEDFLAMALDRGELHAAATLYREAADYAQRVGLPYARHYQRRAAETWWREADRTVNAGAPLDLAENAYLASVECFSLVGDFARVRDTYVRLARLGLADRKRERYEGIAARYAGAPVDMSAGPEFPQHMRKANAYADVWFADLIEWEQDGRPGQVAEGMIGDLRYPDSYRRRALVLALLVAELERRGMGQEPDGLAEVAKALGTLQTYAALRPLEVLYARPEPMVRRAAARAAQSLHFKRSLVLVARALSDPDREVREGALESLRKLTFVHAFQPLAKLIEEHPDDKVKAAAVETLGQIPSIEAGELLIGVVRHDPALREVARRALAKFESADIAPIVRQHAELEADPEVKKVLTELVARMKRPATQA